MGCSFTSLWAEQYFINKLNPDQSLPVPSTSCLHRYYAKLDFPRPPVKSKPVRRYFHMQSDLIFCSAWQVLLLHSYKLIFGQKLSSAEVNGPTLSRGDRFPVFWYGSDSNADDWGIKLFWLASTACFSGVCEKRVITRLAVIVFPIFLWAIVLYKAMGVSESFIIWFRNNSLVNSLIWSFTQRPLSVFDLEWNIFTFSFGGDVSRQDGFLLSSPVLRVVPVHWIHQRMCIVHVKWP